MFVYAFYQSLTLHLVKIILTLELHLIDKEKDLGCMCCLCRVCVCVRFFVVGVCVRARVCVRVCV